MQRRRCWGACPHPPHTRAHCRYSLFTVLFLGTAIGFTHNRYAYSQLHPTHDQNLNLWKELDKIGFTHAGYMLTKASKKRRQPAKKRI